ncbi:MAG: antibiotic biosynthesis monooxygenase family protein [Saprospiraceae bacterium]
MIAPTPPPPYYAVIFTSTRTGGDAEGYAEMAEHMAALAAQQPGYLGAESARDGLGITVSYWESLDAIRQWKANAEHLVAQRFGREKWYSAYKTRVCKVERDYGFGE